MPRTRDTLSRAEARRIALAAQGFAEPRPERPGTRQIGRVIDRLHLLQIDSVNVFARAHTMPLFSRLGAYDPALLARASYGGRRRTLFEYWGHEASLIRLALQPLLRWRMERAARGEGIYGGLARFGRERAPFIATVLAEVQARGPLAARELREGGQSRGPWWGWSDAKRALEWLFWAGRVTTSTRRGFERVYDVPERVFPSAVLDAPTPTEHDAQRALVRHAAQALGVATERDLRDYFRLGVDDARSRLAELVEAGDLLPAAVEGWSARAYLDRECRMPRQLTARALLSPFDPLTWERSRAERLFDFRYRIEIYTPAEKRVFGYYALPFLLDDRIAARLDLKADRRLRHLVVHSIHVEPWASLDALVPALKQELQLAAEWQQLSSIVVPSAWEPRLGG